MKATFQAALLCLFTFVIAEAQSLPSAKPEQVGLSSERLNKMTATLKAAADRGDLRVEGKYESGGGGMVSTAMDCTRFLQMLVNGGRLGGERIVGPKTVAYRTADHLCSVITPGPY